MSSWQANQLKYAFGLGGMMSFYGIIGLIVYLLPGQMVGVRYKILIIVLVLLTIPIALFIAFVVSRRGKKKEEKAAEGAAAKTDGAKAVTAQRAAGPTGSYVELSTGVEEVVQFLKSSNLGDSGNALYSLPWYIVSGTPKSGKTSLSIGSNLNFQTLPSQRQSEQKVIRPTPNVDWRVASEAVFFDTAGRYQTEGVDGDEWSAFIEAIKKARSNRPLDGMILAIDVEQILKSDERESEEVAKILRARLDDAIQRLKIRFPVYLVFTHADAIEGFRDSFSTSKGEDKSLVWGTTIPLEKSENAQGLFDSEYEILQDAVAKRRLLRLSAPFTPVRQLRIFNFPLHFASARRKLGAFVATLFRPNPFSENPFLRGYYFTAAPAAKAATGVKTAGNGYFIERLFKDVILRDKDLVRTFQAQRQSPPIFGWFLTLVALFITFALLLMSGISLATNRQMLNEAKDKGDKLLTIVKADAGKNVLDKKDDEVTRELAATDNLRQLLTRLDDNERNGPPFYMRFGMYSGNKVYHVLLKNYMSVIGQRFKNPLVDKITADLKKFAASQPVANPAQLTDAEEQNLGHNYDLLKAYLMLSGETEYIDKGEASHLVTTLKDDWVTVSKVPSDQQLVAKAQLEFWAKQVDQKENADFPRIKIDTRLVADVREKLKSFPAWQRYYKGQVTAISKQIDDKVGSMTVNAMLARDGADTSLIDGSYQVQGAYTRPGLELMKVAIAGANTKLSEDDWVMGETGKNAISQSTDAANIEARYYRDYADQWRSFVKGVTVKPFKTKDEAANALQTLSSANSPMKILLTEIKKNTILSAKPDVQGWWDWIKSFFASSTSNGCDGTTQPEKEFRGLCTFIGSKDQKNAAPVDQYGTELGKLYQKLNVLSADQIKSVAQDLAQDKDTTLGIGKTSTNISNLTGSFKDTGSGQELQLLLQKPISNLKIFLGVQDILAKKWAEEILPAAKDMATGFPFPDGQGDADTTKITAYLNPTDGKFTQFYKDNLAKYFEESNGQWKVKETAEVKFTDEFVAYVNGALGLQKAMFGTSPTPKFEYEFKFNPVKDTLIAVTIDGQTTDSSGTGSLKGTFPAPSGTQTGVQLKLASTPSAPSAPSNSPSNTGVKQPGGGSGDQTFGGTWGLFKFVEAGKPQKQPTGEYLLTYSVAGKTVTGTIKPGGGDLFDKNVFKQLKAPQTFLK